jgi:hypothetical protein
VEKSVNQQSHVPQKTADGERESVLFNMRLFLSGLFCIARKLALNELDEITPVQQFTTQIGKKQSEPCTIFKK